MLLEFGEFDRKFSKVTEVFSEDDYLENRQFTAFHKIILGLSNSGVALESALQLTTAHIDEVDSWGRSCVSWSARRGDRASLKTLIKYGADVARKDCEGWSPFDHAVSAGFLDCVQSLLKTGKVKRDMDHAMDKTPVAVADDADDNPDLLRVLIEHAEVDVRSPNTVLGPISLSFAIAHDNIENVNSLLRNGVDPNIDDISGATMIHQAIENRSYRAMQALVNHGVDCSKIDKRGQTVLHAIARSFDTRTIDIMKGAALSDVDLGALDEDGKTCIECLMDGSSVEPAHLSAFQDFLYVMYSDSSSENDVFESASEGSSR